MFVNKDAYNALDDATKATIMDCGAKAAANGSAKAQELTAGYLKTLAENGMTVQGPERSAQIRSRRLRRDNDRRMDQERG